MGKAWDRDIAGEYEPEQPDPDKPTARVPHWIPLVISRAEVGQMLSAPDLTALERLLLTTLYGSGIRAKELAALERENIDTALGGLRFGERVALLNQQSIRALAELDWSRWNWPMSRMKDVLRRAARSCGVDKRYAAMGRKLLPQALRIAFATHFLENGSGLFALHNLLGYSQLRDTEMVIEIAVGQWRAIYDQTHPLATNHGVRGGSKQAELTCEDVRVLMEAAGDGLHHTHNSLILRTIYAAGLRVNELTKLLVADIELEERRIFIRQAKEAKDRYTLIDRGTAELLRPLLAGQPHNAVVFPVKDSLIRQFIDRAAEKTGLAAKFDALGETLSPHTFRHAHATHLYAAGMDPVIIKKLLGHVSVEETMGYVACGPVAWREAYERCHLLG
jgi:site-specific recombinase XerD